MYCQSADFRHCPNGLSVICTVTLPDGILFYPADRVCVGTCALWQKVCTTLRCIPTLAGWLQCTKGEKQILTGVFLRKPDGGTAVLKYPQQNTQVGKCAVLQHFCCILFVFHGTKSYLCSTKRCSWQGGIGHKAFLILFSCGSVPFLSRLGFVSRSEKL